MKTHTISNAIIMWQEQSEYMPEPALLIEANSDIISLTQENRYVNINYENVNEFIKILKDCVKNRQ